MTYPNNVHVCVVTFNGPVVPLRNFVIKGHLTQEFWRNLAVLLEMQNRQEKKWQLASILFSEFC